MMRMPSEIIFRKRGCGASLFRIGTLELATQKPWLFARATCNSSAGYYLLGRTRDLTVPLSRTWVGRQRTRSQEFQTSWPASGQKILATLLARLVHCAL